MSAKIMDEEIRPKLLAMAESLEAVHGHEEVLELVTSYGYTILIAAIYCDNFNLFAEALRLRPSLGDTKVYDDLPIHQVCSLQHDPKWCEVLLELHPSQLEAEGTNGLRPLHRAVNHSNLELTEFFLMRGADPSAKTGKGESMREMLSNADVEVRTLFKRRKALKQKKPPPLTGHSFKRLTIDELEDLYESHIRPMELTELTATQRQQLEDELGEAGCAIDHSGSNELSIRVEVLENELVDACQRLSSSLVDVIFSLQSEEDGDLLCLIYNGQIFLNASCVGGKVVGPAGSSFSSFIGQFFERVRGAVSSLTGQSPDADG